MFGLVVNFHLYQGTDNIETKQQHSVNSVFSVVSMRLPDPVSDIFKRRMSIKKPDVRVYWRRAILRAPSA